MNEYELKKLAKYVAEAVRRQPEEFLDIVDAAKMLGVTPAYLRNNAKKIDIPFHKPFKKMLFSRRELEEYIIGR